jgi:hypothetical protein
VTQYVWFNIAVFTISLITMIYGSLKYRKYLYFKNGKLTSWQD